MWYIYDVTNEVNHHGKLMTSECSSCTELWPAVIDGDTFVLVHTDCKEMDLCPIRECFQRKAFLF